MKIKFVLTITALFVFLTSFVTYKLYTDDSFLDSIRYRYKGVAHPEPSIFSIMNIDDTLFLSSWEYSQPVRIKVSWSGDTVERSPLICVLYSSPPPTAYRSSGYDSSIIRFQTLYNGMYQIIPLDTGSSTLISTFYDNEHDTTLIHVRRRDGRLIIEGDRVTLLHDTLTTHR